MQLYNASFTLVNTSCFGYIDCVGTDKPILNFVVDPELLKKLDDFRFKYRFVTRAAAVKWLLEAALAAKLAPAKGE